MTATRFASIVGLAALLGAATTPTPATAFGRDGSRDVSADQLRRGSVHEHSTAGSVHWPGGESPYIITGRSGVYVRVTFGDLSGVADPPARFEIVGGYSQGVTVDASRMRAAIPISVTGTYHYDSVIGGPGRDSFKSREGRDFFDGGGCDGQRDFFDAGPFQGRNVRDTVIRYPGENDVAVAERKRLQLAFVDRACPGPLIP